VSCSTNAWDTAGNRGTGYKEQSSPCNFAAFGVEALQAKVNAGTSRFQVRLQFNERYTDGDGVIDCLRVGDGKPTLTITYTH
jgi:hypothetical protein